MGYETRVHVVSTYPFETKPPGGQELAVIDLCKCGDGPVGKLIAKHTKKAKEGEPPFALYARNPQRQYEGVDLLRTVASRLKENGKKVDGKTGEEIEELSNHLEDGQIISDPYGDYLGVIDIDDFIRALEEELAGGEPYRRFRWALDLLKSIKASWGGREAEICQLKVVTYGH